MIEKERLVDMDGLSWNVDEARVDDVGSFQDDEGKPMAYVKLAYFGGVNIIMISPVDVKRFEAFRGKRVIAGGALHVERKSTGSQKVRFEVAEIKERK